VCVRVYTFIRRVAAIFSRVTGLTVVVVVGDRGKGGRDGGGPYTRGSDTVTPRPVKQPILFLRMTVVALCWHSISEVTARRGPLPCRYFFEFLLPYIPYAEAFGRGLPRIAARQTHSSHCRQIISVALRKASRSAEISEPVMIINRPLFRDHSAFELGCTDVNEDVCNAERSSRDESVKFITRELSQPSDQMAFIKGTRV